MYNTIYTNTHFNLHTNVTYILDLASLLVLYLLLYTSSSKVKLIFVDSFKVVEKLKRENPKAYSILYSTKLFYYFSSNNKINI